MSCGRAFEDKEWRFRLGCCVSKRCPNSCPKTQVCSPPDLGCPWQSRHPRLTPFPPLDPSGSRPGGQRLGVAGHRTQAGPGCSPWSDWAL